MLRTKWKALYQLPSWLDWLLSVVEPLTVLLITATIIYVGYGLVFGSPQNINQTRFKALMVIISDNWKAALLLLVVLFYRTVRVFLEEVQEAFGMRRNPLPGSPQTAPNPPREESH
jgi:ascorbate-specific PTS system EIIC-type component UlaA